MFYLCCCAGLFVSSIILFAFVAFGEQPISSKRLLKEMLGGFIVGATACWLISSVLPLSNF